MPKIVNKIEKRKRIAKSTCNLFIEKGFVNISINQIAKVAGVGKGTIYEYFKNKEDIVFELMWCLQEDYDYKLKQNLLQTNDVKQKVVYLFNLFLDDNKDIQTQKRIYREFLAIYLNNPTQEIKDFHTELKDKYANILMNILTDSIKNKNISQVAIKFIPSIFATIEGFFIEDANKELILDYINNLFKLLETKEVQSK